MATLNESKVIRECIKSKIAKFEECDQQTLDSQMEVFGCSACDLLKNELDNCFVNSRFYAHKLEMMISFMIMEAQKEMRGTSDNANAIKILSKADFHLFNLGRYRREVEKNEK